MSSNGESVALNVLSPCKWHKKKAWKELVGEQIEAGKLKGATCSLYSKYVNDTSGNENPCICGRLERQHSYTGTPQKKYRGAQKWVTKLACSVDVTEYGQLDNDARVCTCLTQVLYDGFQLTFS
jgi:hypothetical protein